MATGPPGSMALPVTDSQPSSDPSWEGDRMFNIYIYDYCNKRGFRKTARELLIEADIPAESAPPINAKQGLLFEWWSVFWVLFTAKSHNAGTEDAMVYTQHQMQQANLRQGSRPLSHQISQVSRMINGTQIPQASIYGAAQLPNTPGLSSALGNPAQMSFPMVGAGPQPNGIPISSTGPNPAGANPAPPQNFTALMPGGQRPSGLHHRPNGVNPYSSPTIAHSQQNPGGNAGPNPQNPMNQLGPSPHMTHMARPGMLPPNANMGSVPSAQTPPFSQLARSPSRPVSPGQGMQPSPSLVDRQTPINAHENNLNNELTRLPSSILTNIRQELGIQEKDLLALTLEDKNRVIAIARQRGGNPAVRKPGPGAPQGPAGPSNLASGMQLANQRPPGQPQPPQQAPGQQPQQPQPPQQRVVKRNSTSPGEEHGQLPNSENSPPERKRVRRSSVSMDQGPPVGYSHQPHQGPQPQQMMNGSMMRPGPGPMPGPMNNFPPHGPPGMANPGMGMPMGVPQVPGNTMSPAMGGGPRGPNMIGQLQYHQGVHAVTKGLAMANLPGGGAGTPTPGDSPFNPGPGQPPFPGPQNNRLGQNKPMGMMPPPSPAGGPPKEQSKDVSKPPGPNGAEGSPRNQQPPNPATGTQGPPNSGGGAQVSTAPPTPSATSSSITAPSPSAVVNGTPTINPATQPTSTLPEVPTSFLTNDFIQSMAGSLEDFDPQALFRPEDVGINFEQDFREWFNPDDPEMK